MKRKISVFISIIFCFIFLQTASTVTASGNLLQNPGFEELSDSFPSTWTNSAFVNTSNDVTFSVVTTNSFSGNSCLSISNIAENDSKVSQEISVIPGSVYTASCNIKTENILNQAGSANITLELANSYGIYTSRELSNTNNDWELLQFQIFIPTEAENLLKFSLRLGGQGVLNKGTAYFDEVSFELVENPDPSLKTEKFFIPNNKSTQGTVNGTENSGSVSNSTIIFLLLAFIIVILIILVELKLKKNNKDVILHNPEENILSDSTDDDWDDKLNDDTSNDNLDVDPDNDLK